MTKAKHYSLVGETGSFKLTGHDATLRVMRKAWEMSWPLLCVYLVIQLCGLAASYAFTGWTSALVSGGVDVATFFIGLFVMTRVITITER
jgi:hypothetical protein